MAKRALLIGIDAYEALEPLTSAAQNLNAIARVLNHPEQGGFAEANIISLHNPTRQHIEETVFRLCSNAQPDDMVLCYFFGHGVVDAAGNLYLASRSTCFEHGTLIQPTAVAATYFQSILDESRSPQHILILDCAFLKMTDHGFEVDQQVDVRSSFGGSRRAVFTSGTATVSPLPQQDSELSIYTRYWLEGIESGSADLNNDGWISVDELHTYTSRRVRDVVPARVPAFCPNQGEPIVLTQVRVNPAQVACRRAVETYAIQGRISPLSRLTLSSRQLQLGLSLEEAAQLEVEVLAPNREYQRRLENYRQVLMTEAERQYPFSDVVQHQLVTRLQQLELRQDDVMAIETEIRTKAEKDYQERLQRYEQAFINAIDLEHPLSETTFAFLYSLQTSLKLDDDDTDRIRHRVLDQRRQEEHYRQNLEEYRQAFLQAIQWDRSLSHGVRERLYRYQEYLQLKPSDVEAVEAEAIAQDAAQRADYQRKLHQYERAFYQAAQRQLPLPKSVIDDLDQLQTVLQLKHKDIYPLQAQITAQIQAETAAYHQKLRHYQQTFSDMVTFGFPLSPSAIDELQALRHLLDLREDDVASVEHEIITKLQAEQESYQERLQRYQQEVRRMFTLEFPPQDSTCEGLQQYRRSLNIHDRDATLIERRIWAQAEAHHGFHNEAPRPTEAL